MSFFTENTFKFLTDLTANNERDWFQDHKNDYERFIREPALQLIDDFAPLLHTQSKHFIASSKKQGGSLMRVYRDARFSKDKSPYKTNIGIQFRHFMGKDVHAPGFYLHVSTDECFIGAGLWRPEGKTLLKIRTFIDENPRAWQRIFESEAFQSQWALSGDSLKTAPKGFPKDHPQIIDLRRKDFIAISPISREQLMSDELLPLLQARYLATEKLMVFLCTAIDVPY